MGNIYEWEFDKAVLNQHIFKADFNTEKLRINIKKI